MIAEGKRLQPLRGMRPDMYMVLGVVFQLFWYRGRASAMEPLLDSHLQDYPQDAWLASIFRAQCALERGEPRLAREHYAALRATGFRRPLSGRLTGLRVEACIRVAALCAAVGSRDDAALLYPMLLPMAQHCGGENYVQWGSVSRPLAELALKQGNIELAHRHTLDALAMNMKIGHRPELVRTRVVLGQVLRALGRDAEAETQITVAREEMLAIGMATSFAELPQAELPRLERCAPT